MIAQCGNKSSSFVSLFWVIGTGASHHVSIDPTTPTDSLPYTSLEGITLGNGETIHISSNRRSVVQFNNNCDLNLEQILHTLKAIVNLISIHKLCKDNQIFVEFDHSIFYVKDLHSKKIIAQGHN